MAGTTPAMHRSIVCVDVAGYGDRRRTNRDQVAMRKGLYESLRRAFTRAGLRWERCQREDRGDGMLILVPPEMPKELLSGPMPMELAAALEAYNLRAGGQAGIRLRAVLHAGEVHHDDHGVAGSAINLAFRLLEAGPLKEALRGASGWLALIASEWFYEEVIRHHPESDPRAYLPVAVSVKETRTRGWVHLPGTPDPFAEHARAPVSHPPALVPAPAPALDAAPGPAPIPAPEAAVPRQLPAAVGDFVGRAAELATLDDLLASPGGSVAISVITGTAGVGKTALAVRAAHRVRERFPGGQLYVDLHGYAAEPRTSPERALDGMLHALGVPHPRIPADVGARSALYRSLLDGRRVLVVLDNAADAAQVRPLLPGTPGCAVLVTSRSDLSGLVAREGARPLLLGRLRRAEAVALLRRIIGADKIDQRPAAAADLARRCAYLPLALRVAAERAAARPHLDLSDLVGELDERDRLDVLSADDEHTGLRTVLSWSYHALTDPAARMFRLLALHPGDEFSTPAASALAGTEPGETRRRLDTLVRAHLLEETPGGRYRLTGLLRCYAAELTGTEDGEHDRAAAVRRVLAWYLHTADNARRVLCAHRVTATLTLPDGPPRPLVFASAREAQEWCEAERLNLLGSTRHAPATGNHDIGWRLPLALWTFFFLRGPWTDWVAAHRTAVESARRAGDGTGQAYALGSLGYACQDLWRFEEAANHFLRSLMFFKQVRDRKGEVWALHGLGLALRRLRRYDEAVVLHRRAVRITEETGDVQGRAWALGGLGFAFAGRRRYAESMQGFEESLALARETDRRAEGWALHGLGYAYQELGRHEPAIDHYERALRIFREIGDWPGQGETLDNLAKIQLRAGRPETARAFWTMALEVFQELRTPQASRVRDRLLLLDHDRVLELPEAEAAVPCP